MVHSYILKVFAQILPSWGHPPPPSSLNLVCAVFCLIYSVLTHDNLFFVFGVCCHHHLSSTRTNPLLCLLVYPHLQAGKCLINRGRRNSCLPARLSWLGVWSSHLRTPVCRSWSHAWAPGPMSTEQAGLLLGSVPLPSLPRALLHPGRPPSAA